MKTLTDEQWWQISDYTGGMPIELSEADPDASFVYDREYGFFIVSFGCHEILMAELFAFKNGFSDATAMGDAKEIKNLKVFSELAEQFIQLPGTCFFSSAGHKPSVWKTSNLNAIERRILGINGLTEIGE